MTIEMVVDGQASLLPVYDTVQLRKWREDNSFVANEMEHRFVLMCQQYRRVSVRDLWGWARTKYAQQIDQRVNGYALNNNLTTDFSLYLCSKYPEYASKVEHRGTANEIAEEYQQVMRA